MARELAEELKMSWVHAPAEIPRGQPRKPRQWWLDFEEQIGICEPGDTGVALLSHFPLQEVVRIDLPWEECAWRPHLSVGATMKFGSRAIRIFNCHLDPHSSANGQIEQLAVIIAHADKFSGPIVLLGDFNTLSSNTCRERRRLLESHGFVTPFPTGTATWHGAGIHLHADWIFVRNLTITRWGVARRLNVSDHWPIWAELDLTG